MPTIRDRRASVNDWNIKDAGGGAITARSGSTGEIFSGTIAQFNAKLKTYGLESPASGYELPNGETFVTAKINPSGLGLEIQDGSDTRSFVTAEVVDGVPTGNFFVAEPDCEIPVQLGGGSGPTVETAATFAGISASTAPRTVIVIADETNAGERTVYFHDGVALNWIPTVGL